MCIPIAQPFLVTQVVDYLSGESTISSSTAYGVGTGVILLSLLQVFLNMSAQKVSFRLGMHLRIGLSSLIFQKVYIIYTVIWDI